MCSTKDVTKYCKLTGNNYPSYHYQNEMSSKERAEIKTDLFLTVQFIEFFELEHFIRSCRQCVQSCEPSASDAIDSCFKSTGFFMIHFIGNLYINLVFGVFLNKMFEFRKQSD